MWGYISHNSEIPKKEKLVLLRAGKYEVQGDKMSMSSKKPMFYSLLFWGSGSSLTSIDKFS